MIKNISLFAFVAVLSGCIDSEKPDGVANAYFNDDRAKHTYRATTTSDTKATTSTVLRELYGGAYSIEINQSADFSFKVRIKPDTNYTQESFAGSIINSTMGNGMSMVKNTIFSSIEYGTGKIHDGSGDKYDAVRYLPVKYQILESKADIALKNYADIRVFAFEDSYLGENLDIKSFVYINGKSTKDYGASTAASKVGATYSKVGGFNIVGHSSGVIDSVLTHIVGDTTINIDVANKVITDFKIDNLKESKARYADGKQFGKYQDITGSLALDKSKSQGLSVGKGAVSVALKQQNGLKDIEALSQVKGAFFGDKAQQFIGKGVFKYKNKKYEGVVAADKK